MKNGHEYYLRKALQMLIQDLAELIVGRELDSPRNIGDIHDSHCKNIESRIHSKTGLSLGARTIRKFKNGQAIGVKQSQSRDIVAAAWFVEMNFMRKSDIVKDRTGKISGYWARYVEVFESRKEELSKFIGKKEAVTHEFRKQAATANELATLIGAFANKDGGYIFFGVGTDDTTLCGIDPNTTLITNTLAALRRFDSKPKVEIGWGYRLNDEKAFFVVKVCKSESPCAVDGIEYLRRGASCVTIDKNERQDKTYKRQFATNSRRKLIADIRRISSVVDDHLDYWDNYKTKQTLDEEKRIFFSLCCRFIADTYVTYLSDIWKEISFRKLPVGNQYVFESVKQNIDALIKDLRKGRFSEFLANVKIGMPVIHEIVQQQVDVLTSLLNGTADELNSDKVYQYIASVSDFAEKIDADMNSRFNLMQTQVRI